MSRAPIIGGTRYIASPSKIGTAKKNIIVTPCMVNSCWNSSAETRSRFGCASWVRMISAWTPPSSRKMKPVTMKRMPMVR
jgi:hypothetical protein